MPRPTPRVYAMLADWYSRALPALEPHHHRWLAKLVCALVEGGCCTQPALATALQRLGLSEATNESLQVGIRRWLADDRLTPATAYAPVVRAVLARWPAPVLVLIIDTTPLRDRLVRLQVSLAYHGRAVPLSWRLYPARGIPAPDDFHTLFTAVLAAAQALLPPARPVVALLDRGFTSPALWDAVRVQGWHPVLRVQRSVRLRTAPTATPAATSTAPVAVGTLLGADPGVVTLAGEVFKKGGWRPATVTALRRDGQPAAWLLVSDLPAGVQRATEYALRMHIEESFRDDKSGGWQWEQSRVRDPARAERLVLLMALATLWCLSVGAVALGTGRAAWWVRRTRPAWSLFRIGGTWLRQALRSGELVPLHHRLCQLPTWRTPLLLIAPAPG